MGLAKSKVQAVLEGFCLSTTRAPPARHSNEKRRPAVKRRVHSLFMPPIRMNGPDCRSLNDVEPARLRIRYGLPLDCRMAANSASATASDVWMWREGCLSKSDTVIAGSVPTAVLVWPPPTHSSTELEDEKTGFQNFSNALPGPASHSVRKAASATIPTPAAIAGRERLHTAGFAVTEGAGSSAGATVTARFGRPAGKRNCGTYDPASRSMRISLSRSGSM